MLVLILLMSHPVFASGSKDYIVTCNHHFMNSVNVLGRYSTLEKAKNRIKKANYRGEWYVYNVKEKAIAWPKLDTPRKKVKKAIKWVKAVANDPRHGYTCEGELSKSGCSLKWNRWGKLGDYSCSTLVATAYELFGFVSLRKIARDNHYKIDTYYGRHTGYSSINIIKAIKKSRKFKDISKSFRRNPNCLKAGDILVKGNRRHVAIMISKNMLAEGIMNEKYEEYSKSSPGDQLNGSEIRMCPYYSDFYYAFRPIV